jgi:putative spermidine/putrescine transport system substrate-binding protein
MDIMTSSRRPNATLRGLSRRELLRAPASGALVMAGAATTRSAWGQTSDKLIVRTTSGGTYGEAMEKAIFAPFTRATGIAVEKTPVAMAPLAASVKQGRPLVDVVDTSEGLLQTLAADNVLHQIDYGRFRLFSVDDVGRASAQPALVRRMVYARALGYRKSALSRTGAPTSWAEFWDVRRFPAARAISGLGLNYPDLEFALLADGVPMANLYPIDIPRAFAAFTRIREHIHTFYPTDAISANLLSSKEVDLLAIANGRIQSLIDESGDYAIEWNQHMKVSSGYSILQGAPNLANAYRFIDFAMSPEVQAAFSALIPYGPTNAKAFALIAQNDAAKLPTNPAWNDKGFFQDAGWWGANLAEVTRAWNAWASR